MLQSILMAFLTLFLSKTSWCFWKFLENAADTFWYKLVHTRITLYLHIYSKLKNSRKFKTYFSLQHPYPSEDQKKQLAQDTGLTILQVNNW